MSDQEKMKSVARSIPRGGDVGYFFDRLTSPEWIAVLEEEGFFSDPPTAVREGDFISFPFWPQSQYLRRMAQLAPEQVLTVIERIPDTDNIRIHEDFVSAAAAMPASLAARLTSRVLAWIATPYQFRLPEEAAKLMAQLAREGEVESALKLAGALLGVHAENPPAGKLGPLNIAPTVMAHMHEWEYQRILSTYVPDLVRADGEKTIALLCDLLSGAITDSRGDAETDGSYLWLSAVEPTTHEQDHAVREHLVRAIRDASVSAIMADPSILPLVLSVLEGQKWQIFRRIALFLLMRFYDLAPSRARQYVLDPHYLDDVNVFHEFWLLTRRVFPQLSPSDQEVLLQRLADKRNVDEAKAEQQESPEERDDAKMLARSWFYRRLTLLKDVLPPTWRSQYETLEKEIGPLEHPEFLYYMSGASWVGPQSPVEVKELAAMSVPQLTSFLRTWTPPEGAWEATPEGLGRMLSGVITEAPEVYAVSASAFQDQDPTYVRAALFGLTEARRAKRNFPWSDVLALCQWVINQPREISGRSTGRMERDPNWTWARKAVGTLLSEGMVGDEGDIGIDRRKEVWRIIEPLTRDPEPTLAYELEQGNAIDPLTLSINTVRGEAMHTVIRYALWVRRSLEADNERKAGEQAGFKEMREVQAVLEEHLEIGREPSRAIRAVYGQWFPWLALLDQNWTAANLPRIFPQAEELTFLWEAAWDAYIVFAGAYDHAFVLLERDYLRAIRDIGRQRAQAVLAEPSDQRLAEHLMVFYWRGKLSLEPSDELLREFYRLAPPGLRAFALGFVGRALHGSEKPPLPHVVRDRLQSLWRWRFEVTGGMSRPEREKELAEFGWWFASEKFEAGWAIEQLCAVLRAVGKVEVVSLVVKAMTGLPDEHLERGIDALLLLIESGQELWDYSIWEEDARSILARALSGPSVAAREKARDLINLASARGFHRFEPLLRQDDETTTGRE